MKKAYSPKIALIKNGRGVSSLDTIMGCSGGMTLGPKGCYDDCYAAKSAIQYGYDFSKFVRRDFVGAGHLKDILSQIRKVDLPFVRVGTSGDPSEDWEHTLRILDAVKGCNKDFVVITKHWNNLADRQLERLSSLNVVFNTSVSALDEDDSRENAIAQFHRLKPYCKSVLRVVTCDFNDFNPVGFVKAKIQDELIKIDENYIDTVFRPSKSNKLVKGNVINTSQTKFLGKKRIVSKSNKKTYFGGCANCPEMCGSDRYHQKQKQRILFR